MKKTTPPAKRSKQPRRALAPLAPAQLAQVQGAGGDRFIVIGS
jgi:hypothetical protein